MNDAGNLKNPGSLHRAKLPAWVATRKGDGSPQPYKLNATGL
jgi:hypothetical protein